MQSLPKFKFMSPNKKREILTETWIVFSSVDTQTHFFYPISISIQRNHLKKKKKKKERVEFIGI